MVSLFFHRRAISLTVCLLRRLVSFAFPPRFVTISFGEMQRKARERVQQKVRNWKQEKNGNELGPRLAMRRRFVCVRWKLYVAHWSHWPVGNQSKVDLKRPSKSVSSEYRSWHRPITILGMTNRKRQLYRTKSSLIYLFLHLCRSWPIS